MNSTKQPTHALLFDLDGTLTDPFQDITQSHQFVLEQMGAVMRTQEELAAYIGPPLREVFPTLLATNDSALIERAVEHYREWQWRMGIHLNELYPGVPEMLAELRERGIALFIVTAKVQRYAEEIARHVGIASYFSRIYGSEPQGRFDDKAELIAHILTEENLSPSNCIMVGDRNHDIIAARKNGIRTLGVTYGYGSRDELIEARADILCGSVDELRQILLGE